MEEQEKTFPVGREKSVRMECIVREEGEKRQWSREVLHYHLRTGYYWLENVKMGCPERSWR